jgi:multidrug efflux pump subunit AcrA (membrane-fusion protein)
MDKRLGIGRNVLPWAVLAVAVGAGAVLLKTPPRVPKSNPARVAAVVGVAELEPRSITTFVEAFGTVIAAREARVQPEVTDLPPPMIPLPMLVGHASNPSSAAGGAKPRAA